MSRDRQGRATGPDGRPCAVKNRFPQRMLDILKGRLGRRVRPCASTIKNPATKVGNQINLDNPHVW